MIELLGFLVGFLVLGPAAAWLCGMFNPMGYLGVPPWRVPACSCSGTSFANRYGLHDEACPRIGLYEGP